MDFYTKVSLQASVVLHVPIQGDNVRSTSGPPQPARFLPANKQQTKERVENKNRSVYRTSLVLCKEECDTGILNNIV